MIFPLGEVSLPSSLMSTIDNTTGKRQFNFAANILKLFKKIDYLAYLTKFKKEKIKLGIDQANNLNELLHVAFASLAIDAHR